VERIVPFDAFGESEALALAASVDQLSAHTIASAIVREAGRRRLPLELPEDVREEPGQGIAGRVLGRRVTVGSADWLVRNGYDPSEAVAALDGDGGAATAKVLVGVDGRLAAGIVMGDHLRPDAPELVADLRAAGVRHVALVTGDRAETAAEVGRLVGVDHVHAEQSPEQKLDVVRAVRARPELRAVVMVGDGINDAPALALADVGIAIGAAGATVASDTADAVIVDDDVARVARAVRIGRRSLAIARQSVLAGIGLSLLAMVFAGLGFVPPLFGALLQEGIDVAVILYALRALRA
jgi:P-type E1-E2 ATPase